MFPIVPRAFDCVKNALKRAASIDMEKQDQVWQNVSNRMFNLFQSLILSQIACLTYFNRFFFVSNRMFYLFEIACIPVLGDGKFLSSE